MMSTSNLIKEQRLLAELFQQAPTFMALLTGPGHHFQYVNPAYLKLVSHREVLGKTVAEALPDAAAQGYVTLLDEVYRSGTPYIANGAQYAMQASPDGTVSALHVDFVYQPIRNEDGQITGIFVHGVDVTDRVMADIRRDALIRMTDELRDLKTPEEITYIASAILGETIGVSRVGYGTIDQVAETLTVDRDWNAPGVETLAGTLNLRDYGSFIDDLKEGKFIAINDVDTDARTAPAASALKARSAGSFVNVPILEQGRLVAVIFVNNAAVREWRPDDLMLIKEIAERTRMASERLRNAIADIQHQKQAEDELAKLHDESDRRHRLYETMLDNSPDLGYVFDLNHCFTYANKVLLTMWGKTWDEAIGKSFLDLGYEPWHAEMHDREIEQVKASRQPIKGEVPFAGAFGRRIYEYIFVPVFNPDGEVEAIAGTTRDVTERKEKEDTLRDSNRRKDEFLAMLAHELRNPLAPISAAAQVLGMPGLNEERLQKTSEIISRQVRHMTGLIDDLLDVSRVTRGLVVLDKSVQDMKAIIYNAVEQVRPLIESHRHNLTLELGAEPAYMLGDENRLVQIASNLLNNAAKYTPHGGSILLLMNTTDDHIEVRIQDNGIDIAPELQPHVFELFTQAERTADRAQGGLGIGLALVKTLAEMQDGNVSCFSEGDGKGSRFTLTFPRWHQVENHAGRQHNTESAQQTSNKRRILIVDDNADAATMLAMHLEFLGHVVMIEHDSHRALERAIIEKPDVCILDIGLPGMDGNELARHLRKQQETAGALLIAVTGYGQEQDKRASKEAGFDRHLVKPVDASALLKLLA